MMKKHTREKLEVFQNFCGLHDHPLCYKRPGGNWVFWSPDLNKKHAAADMYSLAKSKLRLNIQRFNPVIGLNDK
jgi:hypothetical protein